MSWVIRGSKPYVDLEDTDTAKKVRVQNDAGAVKIVDPSTGNALMSWKATLAQIEKKTGLAADSTGVKASSPRAKLNATLLKKLIVRATISSIPSDATVRVEVYDVTKGSVLGYVEFAGATGTDQETEITSGWDDGDLVEIRVNVTTASGTSGATFDLDYAILEAEYNTA